MFRVTHTALRICPFCEATCGLTLTIEDGRVVGARCTKRLDAAGHHAAACLVGGRRKRTHDGQRDLEKTLANSQEGEEVGSVEEEES